MGWATFFHNSCHAGRSRQILELTGITAEQGCRQKEDVHLETFFSLKNKTEIFFSHHDKFSRISPDILLIRILIFYEPASKEDITVDRIF
jgi:hypothetical protein